jgi:hypothetical protein
VSIAAIGLRDFMFGLLLKPRREVEQPMGHTPWVGQACGEIRDCSYLELALETEYYCC